MLYIVGTPIGNIKDITYRAVETLQNCDVIFCEDTRHSSILLNAYDIKKPLISYQKFNEKERISQIVERLQRGEEVCLISDAGMPLISDPGYTLVQGLIEQNLPYTVVSGPCALISGVALSGMDTTSFCFCGFLPEKNIDRQRFIAKYESLQATLIFYSPPHNIDKDLLFLYQSLGDRQVSLVREISKKFEEVIRFKLGEDKEFTKKGEFVIVVEGKKPTDYSNISIKEHLKMYFDLGMDRKDAIKKVASERKIAKSVVYAEWVDMEAGK